jgi:hypothetical protein
MGEDETADAGGGEVLGDGTAEATDAGDEDRSALESALAGFTEAIEIDLPAVGLAFGVVEGWR